MLNRRPRGQLCWVMAFFIASYQQLLWSPNFIGVPEGPFGRAWLSLPHSSISVRSLTGTVIGTRLLSWLSYIIVQLPLDRLLNLWNGMIDRHPAEIAVMQFTCHAGHYLPVHQSMSGLYLVPFHQPNPPTRSLSITGHWNVSLPSGASHCNGMFARTEGQNTTQVFCKRSRGTWSRECTQMLLEILHLLQEPRWSGKVQNQWIQRPCTKPQKKRIQPVAKREYQRISVSHNQVWCIPFTTSATAFGAVELWPE